ncbi:MAG: hypothetical protein JO233_01860 [Candidatus Eremiobacteraeota bacterium]|nr:hypothetical protein [Candidatus Eremiobacteraeota bacterium]
MKDFVNKAADAVEDATKNVRDTVNEASHRSEAEAEQEKRRVAGDVMTPGEKADSVLNEGKNRVQAEWDKTKKDVRRKT